MLRKLIIALIVALVMPLGLAMPACAAEPDLPGARMHEQHAPQRKQDRSKQVEAPCVGCVAPSTLKRPMLEAPVPGLLMIPAALLVTNVVAQPARPNVPPPKLG